MSVLHLCWSLQCRCQAGQGITNCRLDIRIFLVVIPFQLADSYRCCEVSLCRHPQCRAVQDQRERYLCLDCLTLMMMVIWPFEKGQEVLTQHHCLGPEVSNLQPHWPLGWEPWIFLVVCDWDAWLS